MLTCRGEPGHFQAHEVQDPDFDGETIDAILEPYLRKIPFVSDEGDIDADGDDKIIVFREPIVGGSSAHLGQRKLRPHAPNKIHAVEFKLDGSGVVNILNTDVARWLVTQRNLNLKWNQRSRLRRAQ